MAPLPTTAVRVGGAVAAAMLVLGACSNTSSPINRTAPSGTATASVSNGVQVVHLDAGDDYRFHPSTFVVHPGKVEVILTNTGSGAPHNFQVTSFPADFVPDTGAGQSATATFTAPTPGKYRFVCTIHVVQGQVGTMIVESN